MIDVTNVLGAERASLLELLRSLTAEQWVLPTECPAWTVRQLALHILGDDLSLLSRQRDATPTQGLLLYAEQHPGLSFRELLDGFNEQWVTASTFMSNELIVEMLRLAGEWSSDFYTAVGLTAISREPVGFFMQTDVSPYWQVIAREYVERVVHQSQLRRAVDAPSMASDLMRPMAAVIMHAATYWFADHQPAEPCTIGCEFEGVGSWTWACTGNGWTVRENVGRVDVLVRVIENEVVPLLTRGMSLGEVRAALALSGDERAVLPIIDRIAPLLCAP